MMKHTQKDEDIWFGQAVNAVLSNEFAKETIDADEVIVERIMKAFDIIKQAQDKRVPMEVPAEINPKDARKVLEL